jgi:hypothetical protein
MEQLLNTIAQFIQTYGIWFIVFYAVAFAASALVFITAFIIIVKAFSNIDRTRRR